MAEFFPLGFPTAEALRSLIMETDMLAWKTNLSGQDIDSWLGNFIGEVFPAETERRIALWLLCHFVYYNQNEVRYLCQTLLREYVHTSMADDLDDVNRVESRISEIMLDTTFLPLGGPSESGAFILYMFRQANKLDTSRFISSSEIAETSSTRLVFIDDVTLSEDNDSQAYWYLKKLDFAEREPFLLTCVATPSAVDTLSRIGVKVITAVLLDSRNRFFHADSFLFKPFSSLLDSSKTLAEHYGLKANGKIPLGYSNGQFGFGFFYNTPDNVLPIFWGQENGWKPIFTRYNKFYSGKGIPYYGKFV